MAPPTTTESSPFYLGDPLRSKNVSFPIRALYHIATYPLAIIFYSGRGKLFQQRIEQCQGNYCQLQHAIGRKAQGEAVQRMASHGRGV